MSDTKSMKTPNLQVPILTFASLVLTVVGCVSRSPYLPLEDDGGYADRKGPGSIQIAKFVGNAQTQADDAFKFSVFRAIEVCSKKNFKMTRVVSVNDITTSKTIVRTSSYTNTSPTYTYGNFSKNTNYNSFAPGTINANSSGDFSATTYGGSTQGMSESWEETINFPKFETLFYCTNRTFQIRVEFNDISKDDLKPYVQDLLGGLQVKEIDGNSPMKETLAIGDIILKINNVRTTNSLEVSQIIDSEVSKGTAEIEFLRNGQKQKSTLKAVDISPSIAKENLKLKNEVCQEDDVKELPVCLRRIPAGLSRQTKYRELDQ